MLQACFGPSSAPDCLLRYMSTAYSLGYEDKPDYAQLKALFMRELEASGWRDDARGLDWLEPSKAATGTKKRTSPRRKHGGQPSKAAEEEGEGSPAKRKRLGRTKQNSEGGAVKQRGVRREKEEEVCVDHCGELDSSAAGKAGERKRKREVKEVCVITSEEEEEDGLQKRGTAVLPDVTYPTQLGYEVSG